MDMVQKLRKKDYGRGLWVLGFWVNGVAAEDADHWLLLRFSAVEKYQVSLLSSAQSASDEKYEYISSVHNSFGNITQHQPRYKFVHFFSI